MAWADDIVVVDMFSTDDTKQICGRYPQCRFFERDDYIFGNVNFGFDQATSDWIIRLDSDERITPELAAEIKGLLARDDPAVTGYCFWERPFVLGHELRHGFGRRHHRKMLFRRGAARYAVRAEHEDLETSGVWRDTEHGYIHLNYRSVRQYLDKMNYYTDRDVERLTLTGSAPSSRRVVTETLRAFYLYYLKHAGFRDGWVGLLDATMRSVYQFVYWAKLRERYETEAAT